MELEKKIDLLFLNTLDDRRRQAKKPVSENSFDSSGFALKQIENDLNKHLLAKNGSLKYKRVSIFNYADDAAKNEENMNNMVDLEIEKNTTNKKWNSLPKNFKWNKIQDFLREHQVTDRHVISDLRHKIVNNTLDGVTYDHKEQVIKSISGLEIDF